MGELQTRQIRSHAKIRPSQKSENNSKTDDCAHKLKANSEQGEKGLWRAISDKTPSAAFPMGVSESAYSVQMRPPQMLRQFRHREQRPRADITFSYGRNMDRDELI